MRGAQPSLLPAPVLRPQYPTQIVWDWSFTNPYKWRVYTSLDSGATWFFSSDYWKWGADRLFAPDGGSELYYIVGVDSNGVEVTERSNAVRPDDVPFEAPKLATTSTHHAAWNWAHANPYRWNAYRSTDGGATYAFEGYVGGTAREYTPASGANRMWIVGVDAGGKEITNRSNGVIPNGYVRPAAPVITVVNFGYEGDEGEQTVWLELTWTWNPGDWPDDGVFQILGCKDDTQGMFLMATVPASALHARVETTLPLEDTVYYYQMVYIHGNTYGAWTPIGEFCPF